MEAAMATSKLDRAEVAALIERGAADSCVELSELSELIEALDLEDDEVEELNRRLEQVGIAEMARVLRPGGRLVILEITQPRRPPLSWFHALWFERVVPLLCAVAGDREAYTYLPESVKRFPSPEGLAEIMDA